MMSIKQQMIFKRFKKVYKEIQTPDTVFTKEWLIDTVKKTTKELYDLFPDKNFGNLSCSCFDDNMKVTTNYGESVYYVDITFYDKFTKFPWLICRFYRRYRNVKFYLES